MMGSRNKIKKKQLQDGIIPSTGSELVLDTTNFNDNLDSTITNVQKLADKVDDLNTVHIYDELPLEIEGQVAYAQGKFYGGNGSEWSEFGGGGGGLPEGTANQTLRHNGTEWVSTVNSTLTDGNTNTEFRLANNALPDKKYLRAFVDTDGTGIQVYSDTVSTNGTRYASIYSSPTVASVYLVTRCNQFIDLHTDNNMQYLFMRPNETISEQGLRVQTTRIYSATATIFEFTGKFGIYQNGKIVSNYLSGTGSALLEATADGTIQRSTATIPDAQIQSDWNQTDDTKVDYIKGKPVIPQGLPSGTLGKMLVHNGTTWVISPNIKSFVDKYNQAVTEYSFNSANVKAAIINDAYGNTGLDMYYGNIDNGVGARLGYYATSVTEDSASLVLDAKNAIIRITGRNPTATNPAIEYSNGDIVTFSIMPNGQIKSNFLVGTGDRPIVADSTGKLKIGTAISGNTPLEYLSANLSGTEHTFNNATLGITGDLRTRIKFIDVYAVDADGNWNSDLIDSKFVYENDITINSTVSLGGSFKIRLYIEYV